MSYTHDYRLKIGDYTFNGEVEIGGEGVPNTVYALSEPTNPTMSNKCKDALRQALDILGEAGVKYFRLKLKGEND